MQLDKEDIQAIAQELAKSIKNTPKPNGSTGAHNASAKNENKSTQKKSGSGGRKSWLLLCKGLIVAIELGGLGYILYLLIPYILM